MSCFHIIPHEKLSLIFVIEPEFQTKLNSKLCSPRYERLGHKSHSLQYSLHLSMGNYSMVMSHVFYVDKFTVFSRISPISFPFFKELEFVDIFSPCECSLRPFSLRKLISLYRYDFLKKRGARFDDSKKIQTGCEKTKQTVYMT